MNLHNLAGRNTRNNGLHFNGIGLGDSRLLGAGGFNFAVKVDFKGKGGGVKHGAAIITAA